MKVVRALATRFQKTDVRNQICDEFRAKVYRTAKDPNDISITLYESIWGLRKNGE
jgi:hypothetical protein